MLSRVVERIGITKSGVRLFSRSPIVSIDYSHAVIGGGVVGMAIASELSKNPSNRIVVLEKNTELGQETTSRNSEVIHAGLYYPEDSLKLKLCVEGKKEIYSEKGGLIEYRNCGKWIVAQNEKEHEYLNTMYERVSKLGIPIEFVSLEEGKKLEPFIKARSAILNSPTTGIISAHSLMNYYEYIFQKNSNGSDISLGSKVVGIELTDKLNQEYTLKIDIIDEDDLMELKVNNVINSAGLYACDVSNLLLPAERHFKQYYAKGNYYSFTKSTPKINRLVYPCPPTKNVQSLGTHLTIDLGGQIKFGPDLEWCNSPTDYSISDQRLPLVYNDVKKYFPIVEMENLSASYSGIRPKLIEPNSEKKFQDFVIREEKDFKGFINLLGIESPGLTASPAIGKYVAQLC
ncbi:hypothetical protein PACTADRAFT_74489 [Pachysolen tannophilus NRRL Y-2460]|uniref:L-2-hydroxyglutarate dehydrogenase, mitochondrial n=1 Tax=Pachysolen tannophilus NRRL Y-2460 TaxID=669874 RepID=A0A1E4TYN3_PACTA|nr:hypothetical protein PACTADRAFT_74489 [Pachysolen tannophilus NRRL Y-2460]